MRAFSNKIEQGFKALFQGPATPPTQSTNTPAEQDTIHHTLIEQRTIVSPPHPDDQKPDLNQLLRSLTNSLDGGENEPKIKELLKDICTLGNVNHMDLRHARQELTNRLHKASVEKIKRYEQQSQIKRSGYQDRNKYKPFYDGVETTYNCVDKYGLVPPEQDERYARVQQDVLFKTLLVLNELILDHNKLNANQKQGTQYGADDMSVMRKPEAVDDIFADAEAVLSPVHTPKPSADKSLTQNWVLNPDARQRFKSQPLENIQFNSVVSGNCYPALGTHLTIAVPSGNVRVTLDWNDDGTIRSFTCGDGFDGYREVPPEALAELVKAGVFAPAPKE